MHGKLSRHGTGALCTAGLALVVALAGSGCFTGSGPKASRIRSDTNDSIWPQRAIHFVEHGRRAKGVLISATPGFRSAFNANWDTLLVPTPPTALAGPVWDGRSGGREHAIAIAALPKYRRAANAGMHGNSVRFRFGQRAVWILSTDPFIVGLPDGEPRLSWRQFALRATGVTAPEVVEPLDSFVARYVVDEELDQPLTRLVVFPADYWPEGDANRKKVDVSVVTLPAPLRIGEALDAIAAGDPVRLGAAETVSLREEFASEKEQARAQRADRERFFSR